MSEDVALYDTNGNVAIITMNRPDKRNALSPALKDKLVELFRRAEDDDDVAVVVLRGNGKSFCAGADISPSPAKKEYKGDALKTHAHHAKTLKFHMTPWELKKPVIASIQGHAMGAGCEFAMMCDISIAADTAILGEPEIRFPPAARPSSCRGSSATSARANYSISARRFRPSEPSRSG